MINIPETDSRNVSMTAVDLSIFNISAHDLSSSELTFVSPMLFPDVLTDGFSELEAVFCAGAGVFEASEPVVSGGAAVSDAEAEYLLIDIYIAGLTPYVAQVT